MTRKKKKQEKKDFFYCERDSAVPFPSRSGSQLLCAHDIIALHGLAWCEEKNARSREFAGHSNPEVNRHMVSRFPTEPQGRPAKNKYRISRQATAWRNADQLRDTDVPVRFMSGGR